MTNWRWIRFIRMGRLVTVPVIVALNEAGKQSLALTPFIYPQADIDRFLAVSELPVDGDWSDRVARFSVRKRWPGSRDTRRQGWMAARAMLPAVLLMMGGIVGTALLTR
jgi:hypothetical protein